MDREHSGLTFGPLGVQIAWVFSFKVQTVPHREHSGLAFGPLGVQSAWVFSLKVQTWFHRMHFGVTFGSLCVCQVLHKQRRCRSKALGHMYVRGGGWDLYNQKVIVTASAVTATAVGNK